MSKRRLHLRSLLRLTGALTPLACVVAIAAPATAAPVTFGSGHLDWGVKQSFRSYITGPIAQGSYTASEGAVKLSEPDGVVRFEVLGGTYDSEAETGELTIGGSVRFTGHHDSLDISVRNLCLAFAGGAGALYADVSSKDRETGRVDQYTGIPVVDAPSVPAPTPSGGDLGWPSIGTTLNAAAVPAFDLYTAGEEFDPVESLEATPGTPNPRPGGGPCRSVPDDGGGDNGGGDNGGGGGGGGNGTPAPVPDSPAPPKIGGVAKPVTLGAGRIARIATLRCGGASCTVTTPKSVKVKIKRKRYSVGVLAPRALKAGKSGQLRVKLSKAARKALAGRRTTVKVKVTLTADGRKTTKTIKATLKAKKAKAGATRRQDG